MLALQKTRRYPRIATTKNLCAQIPIDLHERVSEERERLGQTTSEYITNLIQDYYNMMETRTFFANYTDPVLGYESVIDVNT